MQTILDGRLAEGRLASRMWLLAGMLWLVSVMFEAVDVLGAGSDSIGRLGLLAALMATAATMVALTGVMSRVFRIEHEVTRILAGLIRTEVRTSSRELGDVLAKLDSGAECPFAQTTPADPVPGQRASGDEVARRRIW